MAKWVYSSVCKKRRFPNVYSANIALDAIWRYAAKHGKAANDKMPCRSYPCSMCRGYHHTSQPLREGQKLS